MGRVYVFNNPIETGLRITVILSAAYPATMDLQKIIYYDYLAVHSGDIENGPSSLHPAVPNRTGEILIRRKIIEDGIDLFVEKGLILKIFTMHGIEYQAGEQAVPFLETLDEKYTLELRKRADWAIEKFQDKTIEYLSNFIKSNLDKWGGEFTFCSVGGGMQ